jgi:hypothetical protein
MLGAILILAASTATMAAPLPPGGVLLNPDVGAPSFTLGGVPANYSVLLDTLVSPYAGDFTGDVVSLVFQDPNTGFLAFAYQFTNTTTTGPFPPALIQATIGDPSGPWLFANILDAGSDQLGSSTPAPLAPNWSDGDPYALLRSSAASGGDVSILWSVLNQGTLIAPPSDFSALIWFATDALDYQLTNVGLVDGGAVGTAQAFAPIPEPTSLVLYGMGLGMFGLVMTARRKRSS